MNQNEKALVIDALVAYFAKYKKKAIEFRMIGDFRRAERCEDLCKTAESARRKFEEEKQ